MCTVLQCYGEDATQLAVIQEELGHKQIRLWEVDKDLHRGDPKHAFIPES